MISEAWLGQTWAVVLMTEIKIFLLAILKGIVISSKFMVTDTNPYS